MICTGYSCSAKTGTVVILLRCSLLLTLKYAIFATESYSYPPSQIPEIAHSFFVACGETVILVTKFAAHNLGADLQVLICWPVFRRIPSFFGYLLMYRLYITSSSTGSTVPYCPRWYRHIFFSIKSMLACLYFKASWSVPDPDCLRDRDPDPRDSN